MENDLDTAPKGGSMYEMTIRMRNEAHRQNIEREFQEAQNIRDAKLARQDAKHERNYIKRLQQKLARQSRS
jgi:hypothetical protein